MILFDLVLHSNYKNYPFLKLKLNCGNATITKTASLSNLSFRSGKFTPIFLSVNIPFVSQSMEELTKTKQGYQLVNRNFWQKLINKYWQETIFISASNSMLENYTNKLKASGLSTYDGNNYKNFLKQFSNDLLHRKIQVSSDRYDQKNILKSMYKNNIYVKYKWFKSLNFSIFFLRSNRYKLINKFLTGEHNKTFPLFILINDKKQIVLSESSEQLNHRQMMLKFYQKVAYRILDNKSSYIGLFFTNLDDAIEYSNYISSKYSKSTRNIDIKIVPTTIQLYYEFLCKNNFDIEFRLVPDLKEISKLVYQYKSYKNVAFDSNQKYGSNYFQGQPIYFIKSYNLYKHNNTNSFNDVYAFSTSDQLQYETVFFNYETALNTWKMYKNKSSKYYLPSKPSVYVSNLETFLTTSDYRKKNTNLVFIPSAKNYSFTKKYIQNNLENDKKLVNLLKHYNCQLKSLFYRILWSLTTRQPVNW